MKYNITIDIDFLEKTTKELLEERMVGYDIVSKSFNYQSSDKEYRCNEVKKYIDGCLNYFSFKTEYNEETLAITVKEVEE